MHDEENSSEPVDNTSEEISVNDIPPYTENEIKTTYKTTNS